MAQAKTGSIIDLFPKDISELSGSEARAIIKELGGTVKVADALGVQRGAVQRWCNLETFPKGRARSLRDLARHRDF